MAVQSRFLRSANNGQLLDDRTLKEALDFQNELFLIQEKLPLYYKFKLINETFWSCILLLILGIPMMLVALVIFIKSGAPVLVKQKRIGLNGRPFYTYKFRTMMNNAPRVVKMGYRPMEKIIDDPRVEGGVGRFLRKYKWDELPQFFNVIKGEMNLIGPRPYIYEENYEVTRALAARYAIRPGISGPWQISGDLNMTPAEKLQRDNQYIEQMSLFRDFQIFLGTLKIVFIKGEKRE
ncbi:MAG: sugar transferase [Bdellovibrionota bacterium]